VLARARTELVQIERPPRRDRPRCAVARGAAQRPSQTQRDHADDSTAVGPL